MLMNDVSTGDYLLDVSNTHFGVQLEESFLYSATEDDETVLSHTKSDANNSFSDVSTPSTLTNESPRVSEPNIDLPQSSYRSSKKPRVSPTATTSSLGNKKKCNTRERRSKKDSRKMNMPVLPPHPPQLLPISATTNNLQYQLAATPSLLTAGHELSYQQQQDIINSWVNQSTTSATVLSATQSMFEVDALYGTSTDMFGNNSRSSSFASSQISMDDKNVADLFLVDSLSDSASSSGGSSGRVSVGGVVDCQSPSDISFEHTRATKSNSTLINEVMNHVANGNSCNNNGNNAASNFILDTQQQHNTTTNNPWSVTNNQAFHSAQPSEYMFDGHNVDMRSIEPSLMHETSRIPMMRPAPQHHQFSVPIYSPAADPLQPSSRESAWKTFNFTPATTHPSNILPGAVTPKRVQLLPKSPTQPFFKAALRQKYLIPRPSLNYKSFVGVNELIQENNTLRQQVAASKISFERESDESLAMLETINLLNQQFTQ